MAEKKPNTSLQNALQDRVMGKGHPELRSDIKKLLDTLDGEERVEAVIERVQRYAVEATGKTVETLYLPMSQELADVIKRITRQELARYASSFISDAHRELVVPKSCARVIYRRCSAGADTGRRYDESAGTRGRGGRERFAHNLDSSVIVS